MRFCRKQEQACNQDPASMIINDLYPPACMWDLTFMLLSEVWR